MAVTSTAMTAFNAKNENCREAEAQLDTLIAHCENGLGFIIIHPGDLGVSILAHRWVQGSVLCQKIRRKLYGPAEPMDTATGPVIACVWELGLIDAEQRIWRDTMMNEGPDRSAYLNERATIPHV